MRSGPFAVPGAEGTLAEQTLSRPKLPATVAFLLVVSLDEILGDSRQVAKQPA
jgi:hypothetical protein